MVHGEGDQGGSGTPVRYYHLSAKEGVYPGKISPDRALPQGSEVMLSGSKIYRRRNLGWSV